MNCSLLDLIVSVEPIGACNSIVSMSIMFWVELVGACDSILSISMLDF
jgi:hypothetical protein